MMRRNALCMTLGITALCGPVTAEEDNFNLGGHVRVNYGHRDWQAPAIRDGLEFESIKLTVDGKFDDFSYKADYRWYENTDFDTVRYADLTWHYDEYLDVTGGITKVPFGLLPFASNSFWFSANYYIGFEDDYEVEGEIETVIEQFGNHMLEEHGIEYSKEALMQIIFRKS